MQVFCMVFVISLMIYVDIAQAQACRCTQLTGRKRHYWIDTSSGVGYIRINFPDVTLDGFQRNNRRQFWFTTRFYECPGKGGIYAATKIGGNYISNPVGTGSVNLVNPGGPFCYDHEALFKYVEGGGEELGSVESEGNARYLKLRRADRSLRFANGRYIWKSLPAVIADLTFPAMTSTGLTTTMDNPGTLVKFAVTPTSGQRLDIKRLASGEAPFHFEVIPYLLCKRYDSNGEIIRGIAIVLRSSPMNYIALNVTEDEEITLPFTLNTTTPDPAAPVRGQRSTPDPAVPVSGQPSIPYNIVTLVMYDDFSRSRDSYILKADIRNQRAIDERFFEALRQPDGTYRLLSTLDPDRYLAIVTHVGQLELAVAPNSSLPNTVINYNFEMDIPDLPSELSCDLPDIVNPPNRRPYTSGRKRKPYRRSSQRKRKRYF